MNEDFDRILVKLACPKTKPVTRAGKMLAKIKMRDTVRHIIDVFTWVGLWRALSFPLRKNLPDFFIIGAAKCGTTTLFDIVTSHPSVHNRSNVKTKEPWYFGISPLSLKWYRCFFPIKKNKKLLCDASVSLLPSLLAPVQISYILPNAKFIVILRDPVERALSHYEDNKRSGYKVATTFEGALRAEYRHIAEKGVQTTTRSFTEYLAWGHYAAQLERWFSVFDRNQFLILTTVELQKDRQETAYKMFDFLGLPKHNITNVKNSNTGKYAPMLPETRRMLAKYYLSYNEQLYSLLGRKFDWI